MCIQPRFVPCGGGRRMCSPGGNDCRFLSVPANSDCPPAVCPGGRTLRSAGPRHPRCHIEKCMVWDGERKAGHAGIDVGADHWAARREKLPSFPHFRRIRIAYQRADTQVHPYDSVGSMVFTAAKEALGKPENYHREQCHQFKLHGHGSVLPSLMGRVRTRRGKLGHL